MTHNIHYNQSGQNIFSLKNFNTFTRIFVRESKRIAHTQLTFLLLILLHKHYTDRRTSRPITCIITSVLSGVSLHIHGNWLRTGDLISNKYTISVIIFIRASCFATVSFIFTNDCRLQAPAPMTNTRFYVSWLGWKISFLLWRGINSFSWPRNLLRHLMLMFSFVFDAPSFSESL